MTPHRFVLPVNKLLILIGYGHQGCYRCCRRHLCHHRNNCCFHYYYYIYYYIIIVCRVVIVIRTIVGIRILFLLFRSLLLLLLRDFDLSSKSRIISFADSSEFGYIYTVTHINYMIEMIVDVIVCAIHYQYTCKNCIHIYCPVHSNRLVFGQGPQSILALLRLY